MSDRELRFAISFPERPKYEPFRGSFADGELHCLEWLRTTGSLDALNFLIQHYRQHGREDLVRRKLEELTGEAANLEARALTYVYLGGSYELTGEWEAATDAYRGALSLEPCDGWTAYFTHNNLGRCLCQLGENGEAERHCRLAIALDPSRPDAHATLGTSLYGQGDLQGAARSWVDATRANAADGDSLERLDRLVRQRPQLLNELPPLRIWLDECRRAVALARDMVDDLRRSRARPADAALCDVCGAKGAKVEVFGGPIDERGRRRAVMTCPGCGKQSLANYLEIDLHSIEAAQPEAVPELPPRDPGPPETPRFESVLSDLFWLSFLWLAIADASGLLGLAVSKPRQPIEASDVWLMGLLAVIAVGVTSALPSVRKALGRVWNAGRGRIPG